MNGPTGSAGTLRVLCLEDSAVDAELVREALAGAVLQLEWDTASDRSGFEELLAGDPYDVILADYNLPGFNAHGALQLARVAYPATPFICVSGTIGEEATVELLKEGAADCVLKNRLARLPFAVQRAIDERARETELRQSEKKLLTAFRAVLDSITITRLSDGEILEANEGFERLFGYTCAESVGKTTIGLSVYADPGTRDMLTARVRESGQLTDFETTFRRKDGTVFPASCSVQLLSIQGEECFVSVIRDITERKMAEEALAASERFRGRLLSTTPTLVYIYDLVEDRNVYTNREITEFLGYTSEQIVAFGSTLFENILHPDDARLVAEHHERLRKLPLGADNMLEVDYRMKRSDGEWRWLHSRDVPFARDDSGVVTQILGSTDDLTDRIQAENALAASESQLKAMFEQAPVGIALLESPGGRIREANARYLEITGWSGGEVVAQDWEGITHPDDVQQELKAFSKMDTGEIDGYTMAKRYIRPDGQLVWAILTASSIKAPDLYLCMVEDITADRAAEELAVRQAERIERTLTSVIDIAGNIAELRDPYTAGHQRRVSELAVRIAESLGMSGHEIGDIRVAALLHDIGKIGVPVDILGKPGPISPMEFEIIRGHAEAGYRIAVSANMDEPIPELIHQHHERCDGSGYPLGLVGDRIFSGAKVLAVADVVEAMMSHRPYRPALGIETALTEIEQGAGCLYDAEVSRACVDLFREDHFEFSA